MSAAPIVGESGVDYVAASDCQNVSICIYAGGAENAGLENAGLDFGGPNSRAGKCQIPVLHFPAMLFGPPNSSPAFSTPLLFDGPSFSMQSCIFSRPYMQPYSISVDEKCDP